MAFFKKGTKGYGAFQMKCPRCHEGELFETSSFSFQKPFDMHKRCPSCDQNYEPEPGFYYGAMFISYILSGWFCLSFVLGANWGLGWSLEVSFFVLIALLALIFVWLFRFSRALWINLMIKYDPPK